MVLLNFLIIGMSVENFKKVWGTKREEPLSINNEYQITIVTESKTIRMFILDNI